MRWIMAVVCAGCVSLAGASAFAAQKADPVRSPLVSALERCRQITVPAQRLACFDQASGALIQASNSGQVRIVDRAQIQQAKRSLFGFSMPRLSIFGDDPDDKQARQLDTTIRSVDQLNNGRYRIVIAEGGAIWETSEDRLTFEPPRKGQKITILGGPLGSYFLKINGQVGIRGRRVG